MEPLSIQSLITFEDLGEKSWIENDDFYTSENV